MEFKSRLENTIAVAMWRQERADADIDIYHSDNRVLVSRMAQAWIDCKCDNELSTRGRALCYGALNITFDMEHFDPVAETHYTATSHNPYNKRSVNMKAYWDNLASYIIESLNESI